MIDVLIAAAGSGTRMQDVVPGLHKGLLPYKSRPIIWHLINQVPSHLQVAVLLGFKSEQIRDFLDLAFPDRNIRYVYVDDWESEKSGTGYSLLQAENYLAESFWYLPCDGLIATLDYDIDKTQQVDYIFTKDIDGKDALIYTWFSYSEDGLLETNFKVPTVKKSVSAFTGVMRICHGKAFFERLHSSKSKEFVSAISGKSRLIEVESWQDFGSPTKYTEEINLTGDFNFAKQNEITFELPDSIVKWWNDQSIPEKKLAKTNQQINLYPTGLQTKSQFLIYKRVEGETLYKSISPVIFTKLLEELKSHFWRISSEEINSDLQTFYFKKTHERLKLMLDQGLGELESISVVNGINVPAWKDCFADLDFQQIISRASTSTIHGDLQFDNVIYDKETSQFRLIDWRPTFGEQLILGDIYYDFAKLLGGIRMNYSQVKVNNFDFAILKKNQVELLIPTAPFSETLEAILSDFVESLGFSFQHVKSLVPLIYLNMAPLHESPFRELLWCKFLYDSQILRDEKNA